MNREMMTIKMKKLQVCNSILISRNFLVLQKRKENDKLICLVGENITTDESLEENTEVRHHIYMPYPLAYRQSAHPPTIQYVPHYRYVFIGDCILFSYILQCLVVYSFSKVGYLKSIINTFC